MIFNDPFGKFNLKQVVEESVVLNIAERICPLFAFITKSLLGLNDWTLNTVKKSISVYS